MRRAARIARLCSLVALALALAGCPGSEGGDDDSTMDADVVDPRGLTFVWHAQPPLSLPLQGGLTVTKVQLRLRDVRAIGDVAAGDQRTSRAALELEFEREKDPRPLSFGDAPPGMYQRLEARLDGGTGNSFVITGKVTVAGVEREVEIEDDEVRALILPFGPIELRSGRETRVHVDVGMADGLVGIDWATVPLDEGKLKLESDDPRMDAVRAGITFALRSIE